MVDFRRWAQQELVDELGDLISGRVEGESPIERFAPVELPPIDWNPGQRAAIDRVAAWRADASAGRFHALTGPAGTGKSTVAQAIRARLRGTRTAWAAMTGKAALRLKQASGVNAKTLHSVLYQPPREVDNEREQKIDLEFEQLRVAADSCLLVVDEASMIGPRVWADIERSSYDKVLLVGDSYQIPPVLSRAEEEERGDDYSAFAGLEGPQLAEVMRSAGAVLSAATHVRERQLVPTESDGRAADDSYTYLRAGSREVALQIAIEQWLADRDDHAIITWRNETRMRANEIIRARLGFKGPLPDPGEPLIVRKNAYRVGRGKMALMNGDVVALEEWRNAGPVLCGHETRWVTVRTCTGEAVELLTFAEIFDGKTPYVNLQQWRQAVDMAGGTEPIPLTYGYCYTGHLSQGSEFRRATVVLPGDLTNPRFKQPTRLATGETMLFAMRFLYTAIARARKVATLITSA